MWLINLFKKLFTPMIGGRCIDTAIAKCQEIEKEGGKSLIAYGQLINGAYHVQAMWYDGKDYQLVFPDPGFKKIERYMGWKEAQKQWRPEDVKAEPVKIVYYDENGNIDRTT
jgi:hypothetical protein